MDGTIVKVRNQIKSWGKGRVFFIDDFSTYESQGSVRVALGKLVSEGMIVRLARGIYCYPRLIAGPYPRPVIPDQEIIAHALAGKERVRIIPYGDMAAYDLGLTALRINSHVYLTDGAPRKINLSGGKKIIFNHTSEVKMFDFSNDTMQKVASAIRYLGPDAMGSEERRKVMKVLKTVPQWEFDRDIKLPPAWVKEIMVSIRNN